MSIERSIRLTGKFTPKKAAEAGTVFSATLAEVLTPDRSGLAITLSERSVEISKSRKLKIARVGKCGRQTYLLQIVPIVYLSGRVDLIEIHEYRYGIKCFHWFKPLKSKVTSYYSVRFTNRSCGGPVVLSSSKQYLDFLLRETKHPL